MPPLYRTIAGKLRQAIASGRYAPGASLPAELELCAAYGVSRHTAREALRLLTQDGLIERRRGAGTRVAAPRARGPFVQTVSGMDGLLQYARAARLMITAFEPANPRHPLLQGTRSKKGWVRITGLRGQPNAPIALTEVLVRADLCPAPAEIERASAAIVELIAARSGIAAARIQQTIAASATGPAESALLNVKRGVPALSTTRHYWDAHDALILASLSLHPAERFTYAMTFTAGPIKAPRVP